MFGRLIKAAYNRHRSRFSIGMATALMAAVLTSLGPSLARADDAALVKAIDAESYSEKAAAVEALAKSGSARAAPVLEALASGNLFKRKSDGALVIAAPGADPVKLTDAATGADAGAAPAADLDAITTNNRVRRLVEDVMGALSLMSPDAKKRIEAAETIFKARPAAALPALETAIAAEKDASILAVLKEARAAIVLADEGAQTEKRLSAIETLRARGGQESLSLVETASASKDAAIAERAAAAASSIKTRLTLWNYLQNVWYGLSLGSVLLLAAIGLAITFGVMGVINMAHGEMVMLGAYATFLVQEWMRAHAPGLLDYSLLVALPVAFIITGAMGILIERGIIRFLYGRPLETLLATFGVSLILQQTVRAIFGPTNREVSSPSWMSGAFELGGLSITYGRLWIIVFSLAVLAGLHHAAPRHTLRPADARRHPEPPHGKLHGHPHRPHGLMPSFALGSGIAGIAGVALSQIDNVSPQSGPELHHRQLHGRGLRRRRQSHGARSSPL